MASGGSAGFNRSSATRNRPSFSSRWPTRLKRGWRWRPEVTFPACCTERTAALCESSRRLTHAGCVGRSGAQPHILNGAADGEVVKALPIVAGQTECAVQHIIEVAANAGAAHPRRLRRQIQGLADHSGFPEQSAIGCRAALSQDWLEPSQHPKAERTVGGNVLVAGKRPREIAQVALTQPVQRGGAF